MGIALDDDQRALAEAIGDWARSTGTAELAKQSEEDGPRAFEQVWKGLTDFGAAGIVVAEEHGGAGGSLLDLAVAVEAASAAMVPGPLLTTGAAAVLLSGANQADLLAGIASGEVSIALGMGETGIAVEDDHVRGTADLVWGVGTTTHLLLPTTSGPWVLLEADRAQVDVAAAVDLATRVGTATVDLGTADAVVLDLDRQRVLDVVATLAAAEASGIARWSLDTAVAYAKVREQFGRTIGSFQAIKHLCAEMLEAAESATAVAWDAAAAHDDDPDQFTIAAAVAAAVALDHAVATAQDAIQVLGGIGYTWEHDAHLYLRRATVTRQLVGGSDRWRLRLADLARSGVRRAPRVDLGGAAQDLRAEVRALAQQIAAKPDDQRRTALVDAGLAMPHWPAPYGRGAGPVDQLVIDEELAAAGLSRPSLGIGAWAAPTILQHGADAQRERFLWPSLRGEITWCQLFSEPGAGSDLASLRTRAERTEGGWLLHGQKVWTSLAAQSDWAICLARTNPDAPQHQGISYFLVDMSTPGIDIRPLRELTGDALFNEVFLDGVLVPDDCLVGEVDGGWPLARTTLANERVAISDSSFGISVERALRVLADRDVGEAVWSRVGGAVADAGTTKALGLRGTLRSLTGQGPGAESSVLKLVGVRQRQDSAELVLDLLATDALLGRGEGPSAVAEALVTRCLSIAGGTTQVLRNVAAERILGLPRT